MIVIGFLLQDLRLSLLQLILIGVLLDQKNNWPFFTMSPSLKQDLFQETPAPGP